MDVDADKMCHMVFLLSLALHVSSSALGGIMQVFKPASLTVSSAVATTGVAAAPFTFEVTAAASVTAAVALTYTLDKGDGAGPATCVTLGTTTAGALAAAAQSAVSVTYTTAGTKTAVLRVFTAAACPANSAPGNATVTAVGTAVTYVSLWNAEQSICKLGHDAITPMQLGLAWWWVCAAC